MTVSGKPLPDGLIAFYAVTGGFPRSNPIPVQGGPISSYSPAVVAVAICFAESRGIPDAENVNANGTKDVGLWQINDVHKDDPEFVKRTDPAANGRMAFRIYTAAGNKFTPWTTFKSGAYAPYLLKATQAVQSLPANVQSGGISGGGATYTPWLAAQFKAWLKGMGYTDAEADKLSKDAAAGSFTDILGRGAKFGVESLNPFSGLAKPLFIGGGALLVLLGILLLAKANLT